MNKNVDYNLVNRGVLYIFNICNITSLPVDLDHVKKILSKKYNCRFIPYSLQIEKHKLTIEEMYEFAGSNDGCCIYNATSNQYLIFYNDVDSDIVKSRRFRWNIAHEIGHMVLRHNEKTNKSKLYRNQLTEDEYKIYEDECENFATLLLAHPVILNKLKVNTPSSIVNICDISNSAAKSVFKYLPLRLSFHQYRTYDKKILFHFYKFINVKLCLKCGHTFVSENAKFCAHCGKNRLIKGDVNMIYKNKIELDKDGKCIICPVCENEDLDASSHYCKICGTYIIQKCIGSDFATDSPFFNIKESTGCDHHISDGNARYCTECGCKTSLYHQRLLKDWRIEKQDIEDSLPF